MLPARYLPLVLVVACRAPATLTPIPAGSATSASVVRQAPPDASATSLPAPPPVPRSEAACTGPDLDLDRAFMDQACDLDEKDPRVRALLADPPAPVHGGTLVYEVKDRQIRAKPDEAFAITVTVTNVGSTPCEIVQLVQPQMGFRAFVKPTSNANEGEGTALVQDRSALVTNARPRDWWYGHAVIPPHGIAHARIAATATITRTEHLEAAGPGAPAPWRVTPYPLDPGTYTCSFHAPWSEVPFDGQLQHGPAVILTVQR